MVQDPSVKKSAPAMQSCHTSNILALLLAPSIGEHSIANEAVAVAKSLKCNERALGP